MADYDLPIRPNLFYWRVIILKFKMFLVLAYILLDWPAQLFLHNFLLVMNSNVFSWTDLTKDETIRRILMGIKTAIISMIDSWIWAFMFVLFVYSTIANWTLDFKKRPPWVGTPPLWEKSTHSSVPSFSLHAVFNNLTP